MLWIPPRKGSPINWGAVASWRAALEPKPPGRILPNPRRMSAELFAAVQTPLFLFQIGPMTTGAVLPEQVELFIERQGNVFHVNKVRRAC